MIRALVVDDSGFMRMALRRIIEAEGDIRVVGEAGEGEAALEMAGRLQPDIVTMDLEMPGLDGIAATRRLVALPDAPAILMVSHHTREGSENALAALAAGAADVLWKGSSIGGLDLAQIDRELRGRLRHWAAERGPRRSTPHPVQLPPPPPPRRRRDGEGGADGPVDVVVLAASTGGPDALASLIGATGSLPVPCVVAQHMPADLGPDFARHLARRSGADCVLASHGMPLLPGRVVVVPGGTDGHLARAADGTLALRLGRGEGAAHPSADMLFRSAALVAQRAVGLVLTGMGRDGAAGAAAMRERGMVVMAQSPASCVVAGMPGAVIEAGLAMEVADPVALGVRLRQLVLSRARARAPGEAGA